MVTNDFQGLSLSRLGFGAMRLPVREDQSIDTEALQEMVDYAISHGVNYFDTAWPYHSGTSEVALGKALSAYPRDSWYLANKYPGHQIAESYHPEEIFEKQLEKCGVDYFDFYLLHNVYENSIATYMDPRWDILNYFLKQKEAGRIRHLGFSSHARPDTLERFLDYTDGTMEFCQIQLNYLDWTLQDAKAKYDLLTSRNVPVWVMEPLRGGKLAALSEEDTAQLRACRPQENTPAWSFRWLQALPNVKVVLSGMSNLAQMQENVETFTQGELLSAQESDLLLAIAEKLKNAVPCTRCRYCCDGCPMQLDIPTIIHAYNDVRYSGTNMMTTMQFDAMPEDKLPSACVACGACAAVCPQGIDIPDIMEQFSDMLAKSPNWAEICRQRAEAAKKAAAQA